VRHKGIHSWGGTQCDASTAINEKHGKKYYSNIYPNPAQNSINFEINFENEKITNSYLIIRDVIGRHKGKYSITAKNIPVITNTETFSNGIYFYSVYNNGVLKETGKFIISK
jgi:hypothetical protein